MPIFSNTPPEDTRGVSLTLKRCPTNQSLKAIVTSADLIGCPTHFYGGRTVPCEETKCEPCLNGVPWRWHSYLSCWAQIDKIHFLFESTARASEPFVNYRKAHGSLRGCLFRAQRMNSRPNARVFIETKPFDLAAIDLPDAPDLAKVLAIIWNLPESHVNSNGRCRNMPHAQVDKTIPLPSGIGDILKKFSDAP